MKQSENSTPSPLTNHFLVFTVVQLRRGVEGDGGWESDDISPLLWLFIVLCAPVWAWKPLLILPNKNDEQTCQLEKFVFYFLAEKVNLGLCEECPTCTKTTGPKKDVKHLQQSTEFTLLFRHFPVVIYRVAQKSGSRDISS